MAVPFWPQKTPMSTLSTIEHPSNSLEKPESMSHAMVYKRMKVLILNQMPSTIPSFSELCEPQWRAKPYLGAESWDAVDILRNIDVSNGLCNGTKVYITRLLNYSIIVRQYNNPSAHECILPRITFVTDEVKCPFRLRRRQLPVRPAYAINIHKARSDSLSCGYLS
jgi:hypothetical protein